MYIQLNSQILFYEKTGEGQPIILLHGNGGTHEIFDELARRLSRHYTVYAIDTRGHGLSATPKEFHYDDMVEDMKKFIHALELNNPILYGYSDGGIIGLLLAIKYPGMLSALMVSGANMRPKDFKGGVIRATKRRYRKTKDPLLLLTLKEPAITPEQLSSIQIPVLVLAGQKDIVKKSATQKIARSIPDGKLKILPGETHGSYVKQSPKLYPILKDFIKQNLKE